QGLAVVGVTVAILNTDTGIEHTYPTNQSGIYVAPFQQPGHYQVTATKEGFATIARKELVLQIGQTLTIDIQILLRAVENEVTVTGEMPLIEIDKTGHSQVVSENLVANLPIAGRRWDSFVLLTPNVTTDGPGGLVSYRGVSGLYNSNNVDGANN